MQCLIEGGDSTAMVQIEIALSIFDEDVVVTSLPYISIVKDALTIEDLPGDREPEAGCPSLPHD